MGDWDRIEEDDEETMAQPVDVDEVPSEGGRTAACDNEVAVGAACGRTAAAGRIQNLILLVAHNRCLLWHVVCLL